MLLDTMGVQGLARSLCLLAGDDAVNEGMVEKILVGEVGRNPSLRMARTLKGQHRFFVCGCDGQTPVVNPEGIVSFDPEDCCGKTKVWQRDILRWSFPLRGVEKKDGCMPRRMLVILC